VKPGTVQTSSAPSLGFARGSDTFLDSANLRASVCIELALGLSMNEPRILVINDDRALVESRRRLLEDCGAIVFTARGSEEALRETLHEVVDLVLIDATNVGLEQGEKLCGIVKSLRPSECVAMLVQPEIDILTETLADRVIYRSGPRRILVEINEVLNGRLDVDLWEGRGQDEDEDRSTGGSE
jgi:CheY-like chemotaxis protein